MVSSSSSCPTPTLISKPWWIALLWLTISARRWTPRRGDFRDRPLKATLTSVPTHSKAFSRGTKVHLISGTVLYTRSATSFSINDSRTNSKVVSRHHVRGTLILPPWRLVPLTPPTSVFVVEKRATCLITVLRSIINRYPRVRTVTRKGDISRHQILERWTMCLLILHKRRMRSCWVHSVSTLSQLPFFFIQVLHILSFHKLLLECIAYLYVP